MHYGCASVPNDNREISVVVPLLNEVANLPRLIRDLNALEFAQTILVDGGSTDGTLEHLEQLESAFQIISSEKGRARQMNAGAAIAECETLLFLHADTKLPSDAKQEITRASHWGHFDVQFDSPSIAMRVVAFFINRRSRLTDIATGDQAIFVTRTLFDSSGGFPDIPLMEDVAICKTLKRRHKPYSSTARVTTSARRWQEHGVVKTVLQMWWYRLAYFLGISPATLKRGYHDVR